MSSSELSNLDVMRGSLPRAVFMRFVLENHRLMDAAVKAGHLKMTTDIPLVVAQDAPSAPIDEHPAPTPPPKEELRLPAGSRAFEMKGKAWGTLRIGDRECDLTGVELEAQVDGSVVLRFSNRSLVRMARPRE